MKKILLLFLCMAIATSCTEPENSYSTDNNYIPATGKISFVYNGEVLEFENINVSFGGPDSSYALEVIDGIPYEDVNFLKFGTNITFQKIEGQYVIEHFNLSVTERLSTHSFTQRSYYAQVFGDLPTTDFNSETYITEEGHIMGTFSGDLHNIDGEVRQVQNGTFEIIPGSYDEL